MIFLRSIKIKTALICYIFIFLVLFQNSSSANCSYYVTPELPYSPGFIQSRILFSGFDHGIMNDLLTPSDLTGLSLLQQKVYYYFDQEHTEKTFFVDHSYEIASLDFDTTLLAFLNSSSIPDTRTDNDGTSDRYRRLNPREFNYTGRFIPAESTINWLSDNYEDYFGPPPIPGYTLMILNMTKLDDVNYPYHWYNNTYIDPDSNASLSRSYMTGYGSNERLFFLDLSSDSYYLQDARENSTIQEMSFLYDFTTQYGLKRLAEYLSEWIYQIERNLWAQNFTYLPKTPLGDLSTGLQIYHEILVFCNITGFEIQDLNWIVNKTNILEELRSILPWIKMEMSIKLVNLQNENYSKLNSLIHQSLVPWGDYVSQANSKFGIDLIPVYEELYQNNPNYMKPRYRSFYTTHFKTFAFLFDDALFGIPNKAQLEPGILGIALRDSTDSPLTIIGEDFKYIYGNNRSNPKPTHGLSQVIIHETGHQLGLMHPFHYGVVGGFINDVMSYYSHSSQFSIFSKDNIQRGQIDILLKKSRLIINQAAENARDKVYDKAFQNFLFTVNNSYFMILEKYNEMNYSKAYSLAFSLYNSIRDFDPELVDILNIRSYTDMIPTFYVIMLSFFVLLIYYRSKYQTLKVREDKGEFLTSAMVDRLDEVSRERIIESKKALSEKISEKLTGKKKE